jgi:hypothetical protein
VSEAEGLLRRVIASWREHWDCSASPGHAAFEAEINAAEKLLGEIVAGPADVVSVADALARLTPEQRALAMSNYHLAGWADCAWTQAREVDDLHSDT